MFFEASKLQFGCANNVINALGYLSLDSCFAGIQEALGNSIIKD
jgi:hypothetical protein